MKTRLKPGKPRALLDLSALKEPPFTPFTVGLFLTFIGIYFPFFYVPVYSQRILGLLPDPSSDMLAILNATSVFGRVLPGLIADKTGSLNALLPCAIMSTVLGFIWLSVSDMTGIILFSVFYGFFSGALVTLPLTVIASLTPDLRLIGTRIWMSFSFASLGLLIGNPIAGAILNVPEGKFGGAQIFGAATVLAGVLFFSVVRLIMSAEKG